MKAIWNGEILADSDQTVILENNHYFPLSSLNMSFFEPSEKKTSCFWKGQASYYSLNVAGEKNIDAAWYYPRPKKRAEEIKGMVAFWKGVEVIE